MEYPNVDTWTRENEKDAYVYVDGKNVRMNLSRFIPNSHRRFNEKDKEIVDSLETFIVERGLFLKKIDVLCKYMDYFIEFFDDDKELPIIMIYMKNKIDSTSESLTMQEFIKMLQIKFFKDTGIKRNIYRMVDANYRLDVTLDAKTGRVFNGPNDFNNEEAKHLLAISIFMKMVIPITSQYISTNTLYTKQELSGLITQVFVECFYNMGTYEDIDADELLKKLYIFTRDKILKHHNAHSVLWNQQCALRGLTETQHVDTILTKHLLGNNMFKFQFDNSIISFMKSIVETQLMCTINKVKYKVNPIRVDGVKDYNGLAQIDKLEQSMAKLDEGQVIRCKKSLQDIALIEKEWGLTASDEEIDYYMENFYLDSVFHMELLGYFYAHIFDGYTEFKTMDVVVKLKLLIMAKKKLIQDGFEELSWLLTSVQKGRSSARLLQNARFTNKFTSSTDYHDLMDKKYKALKGFKEEKINGMISFILNNIYTYVEYDNQELTGTEIEFNEDIIGAELQRFMADII